nr:PREDICTED: 3 beta-hydroxysteroid dehydrogenase type 7-like [Latimeria chalumnae]|eukprot:XP_014352906.1 PREDICTED: 3 beta-hydroxysteroid dehydrogenase type 7-like [Latimeria chalumnae]
MFHAVLVFYRYEGSFAGVSKVCGWRKRTLRRKLRQICNPEGRNSVCKGAGEKTVAMAGGLVYMVTGGCGFLGERIVELLAKEDSICEVRVFDQLTTEGVNRFATVMSRLFPNEFLVYNSCSDAAIVDYLNMVPFEKLKAVNVREGDAYKGMVEEDRQSSIVKIALQPPKGDEDTLYSGEQLLLYGKTKAMAEELVLGANGKQLKNGNKLFTCAIRPSGIYGEKHKEMKNSYLHIAAKNYIMDHIIPMETEQILTYIGK